MEVTNESDNCFIAVDAGTTNMRVWLVQDGVIRSHQSAMVGVRDTAKDGNNVKLRNTLKLLIEKITDERYQPKLVVAAGMITSALGLKEVKHIEAPATKNKLAESSVVFQDPEITALPIWLIPGVKNGEIHSSNWFEADVMRGEETFTMGLVESQHFVPPFTILNLGSHWKVINVGRDGAILSSRTSLAGEMIYATQTNTILASAVSHDQLETLDVEWCRKGIKETERSGLSRALFCVRLLELQGVTEPTQRMSFLIGAFVADELKALITTGCLNAESQIITVGKAAVLQAWQMVLADANLNHSELKDKPESYFIKGIEGILKSRSSGKSNSRN